MSFLGRLGEGLLDPIYGASQLLENSIESLSPAAADAMGKADDWLHKKTGGLLGLPEGTDVDKQLIDREKNYAEKYGESYGEGVDWARMLGNVGTGVALAPAIPAGAGMLKTAGLLGAEGAAFGAAMPQTDEGRSYGDQVLEDALLGGALGAGIGAPLSKAASKFASLPTREIPETAAERATRELPYYKAVQDVPEGVALNPKDMEFIARQVNEVNPGGASDIVSEAGISGKSRSNMNWGKRNPVDARPDTDARALMSQFDESITGHANDEKYLRDAIKKQNDIFGEGNMPWEVEHELTALLDATELNRARTGDMRDYTRDLIKKESKVYADALEAAKIPYKPRYEEKSTAQKLSPYISRAARDGGLLGVIAENYNSSR